MHILDEYKTMFDENVLKEEKSDVIEGLVKNYVNL